MGDKHNLYWWNGKAIPIGQILRDRALRVIAVQLEMLIGKLFAAFNVYTGDEETEAQGSRCLGGGAGGPAPLSGRHRVGEGEGEITSPRSFGMFCVLRWATSFLAGSFCSRCELSQTTLTAVGLRRKRQAKRPAQLRKV